MMNLIVTTCHPIDLLGFGSKACLWRSAYTHDMVKGGVVRAFPVFCVTSDETRKGNADMVTLGCVGRGTQMGLLH